MSTLKICSIENNEDKKGNFKGYIFLIFFSLLFFLFLAVFVILMNHLKMLIFFCQYYHVIFLKNIFFSLLIK